MVDLIKRNKALSVMPLKVSSPLGGSLAILGLHRAIPMLHGSQGCTAFAKVMSVRHFREPIPLQTTAMDQVGTVMGADEYIIEGLKTICDKNHPDCIGLLTTGLSETQGTDIQRCVKEFRQRHPEHQSVAVVAVNTPDYAGSLESGFAATVMAVIEQLVPNRNESGSEPGRRKRQLNVLVSSALTPGDIEALRELIESFELRPLMLPDLADSLDGHLPDNDFNPLTIGGTPISELALMGDSLATLVVGPSLFAAAQRLYDKTGVPNYYFDSLLGLAATDALVHTLGELSGRPVPVRLERQRAQLQDAMLDCHFMLGQLRVAIAAEPDEILAMTRFIQAQGAEVVAAVTSSRGSALESLPLQAVKIGDLEDLQQMAQMAEAQLLMGNSHLAAVAQQLSLPLQRMGFPQYDLVGGYQRTWIGYRGARQLLFDLSNLVLAEHGQHEVKPYRSRLSPRPLEELDSAGDRHGYAAAIART